MGRWPHKGWVHGLLCAFVALAHPTHAEPTSENNKRETHRGAFIEPPRPLFTPVDPLDLDHGAEVVLELVIGTDGRVLHAAVISGPEPFGARALQRTLEWRFEPASRDGQPQASRIQFLVSFEAQPRDAELHDVDPNNATPASRATRTETLTEVLVLGVPREPTSTSVTRAEIQNLAGAFGDPLRALEALPGVTPIASGLPLFFIRGAPPGNVGFFIDGIRIPLLYHAFLGPSVLHPAFIDEVTLNAGPMPVRLGRYAGASVEARPVEPRGDFRGEASVRLLDAGGFLEAPLDGGRGYAMAGARYSYAALIASLVNPGLQAEYWDYQLRAGYRITPKDELSLFTFGAYDYVSQGGENEAGTEFHRVDLRYDHSFSDVTKVRVAGTFGRDRTRSSFGFVSDTLALGRVALTHEGSDWLLRVGSDVSIDTYGLNLDPLVPEPEIYLELFPARTDVSAGAYADVILFRGQAVEVTPGVRVDVYSSLGDVQVGVDPRVFASYKIAPKLRMAHGVGIAHQSPNFMPGVPGAQVGGLAGGLQRSVQAESRLSAELPWEMAGSVAVFLNGTFGMSDPIGLNQSFAIDETSTNDRAFGRAFGVELFLHRPLTRRFGGLLSYTWMTSVRTFDSFKTPPGYDRPHTLNLALTYDLGAGFRASAKLAFSSGIPGRRTTLDGFMFDQSRSSPLYRLDLKLEKRWYLTDSSYLGANAELLNATYSPNVTARVCSPSSCTDQGTTPLILPSIGVEYGWK